MFYKIANFIFLLLGLLANSVCAQEKDTITWVEDDFPPVFILKGQYKGSGGGDLIHDLMIKKLTSYNHNKKKSNTSRLELMMKQGKNVCSSGLFKTKAREILMYFNKVPSSFILSNGIIYKKKNTNLITKQGAVSIAKIIKNTDFKLGIIKDRKYGDRIDRIIEDNKANENVYERATLEQNKGLIGMLLLDRVDYILGFDWELQYLVKEFWSPKEADSLMFSPVQEALPYAITYIACSKTEWGEKVINEIDAVLLEETKKPEYRNIWKQWISNKKLYDELYDKYFLK